jgi:hypothetical protein
MPDSDHPNESLLIRKNRSRNLKEFVLLNSVNPVKSTISRICSTLNHATVTKCLNGV